MQNWQLPSTANNNQQFYFLNNEENKEKPKGKRTIAWDERGDYTLEERKGTRVNLQEIENELW